MIWLLEIYFNFFLNAFLDRSYRLLLLLFIMFESDDSKNKRNTYLSIECARSFSAIVLEILLEEMNINRSFTVLKVKCYFIIF